MIDLVKLLVYISIYFGLIATTFYILGYRSDKKREKPLFKDSELPKVSVIIPAWNEEKSIAKTIRSMVASKYPKGKLEVIVVDDGSKDKTYSIAKKFRSKLVKVYTKKNGGKGHALNYGIKRCTGEVVFTMDADTMAEPQCIREMTRYFKNPKVMAVTPSMLIYKPKGILQRVQQAEYLFGLFIRKAFTSINAIHVTPGAFSAYRKTFFDKYGGYDTTTLSEDLEIALRIQSKGYIIEYSPESPVYTIGPNKFKELLIQRRRWYTGLVKITWRYKRMFSRKYGDLGLFVMPVAWISIFLSVIIMNAMAIRSVFETRKDLIFLNSVNFDFASLINVNKYFFERFLFNFFTNEIMIFLMFFIVILWAYMRYATKKTGNVKGLPLTILIYFFCFAILFAFWWTVSIFYVLFNKEITWR